MNSKTNKTRSFRPSPALVIACIALFAALTGSALAAGLAKNSVRSPQIVDGTIRNVDLHENAVGTGKIAENAVTSREVAPDSLNAGDLAPNSVGSSEVADQSLTAEDLGPNSVGSSELQAGSVRASELGPIFQVSNSTPIATGANGSVSVNCPEGSTAISGGAQPANFGVEMTSSFRQGNGWEYQAKNNSGAASTLTVFAYCLAGGSSN